MDNFIFHNPTRLIFGKGMIAQLSQQIPADKRIMITFGGGSVKTNGVYEQVIQALEGRDYTEFWGIESNPDISTLKKAIESGKEKNIDFLLAVGGGSVIDGTKLISAGIPYDGDAWELVKKGSAQNTIPLGTTKNHSKKMKTSEFQRIQRFSFCFNCAKHADLGISIVPNSWLFFEPLKKATI